MQNRFRSLEKKIYSVTFYQSFTRDHTEPNAKVLGHF